MADFNQILTPGDVESGIVNVVVEIPQGSSHKIEWNRELAVMQLDRVEPAIFAKPTNYGFIPQTLDEDGDELDALIITDEPLTTGIFMEAKVIGVLEFVDDNEVDDKVIVVPADDRNTGNSINSLEDLPPQLLKQIEHHFNYSNFYQAQQITLNLSGVEFFRSHRGNFLNNRRNVFIFQRPFSARKLYIQSYSFCRIVIFWLIYRNRRYANL
jgi:inorganic pyrophosphatase